MAGTIIGEAVAKTYNATADADTATRRFKVRSDNRADEGPDILTAPGLPQYQDIHPGNPFLKALEFDAQQDPGTWWLWLVDISYAVPDTDEDENPINREAETTYSTETITVAATGGVDESTGQPTDFIGSSAGEPFDPPPERELEILVINIRRWETAAFSLNTFYDFQGAANSNAFTFGDATIAVGQAKLRATIGKKETYTAPDQTQTDYREVNYTIAVSPIGWDFKLLDAGTYYKDGDDKKAFIDKFSQPYTGLLDGAGGKLPDGNTPVFRDFKALKRRSFAALSLPAGP